MANQPKRYKKFVATAATATLVASAIAPVASASFKDVADNNDHKKNIEAIAELGYMGAGDNFRPSENVTRGQVAIILANWAQDVAGLEVPADYKTVQRFKDVPLTADDKLLQSAALVKDYGIFEGSNGNLNGANPISREHMALVLNKAFEAVNGTSLVDLAGDTSDVTFADEAKINKNYLPVVKALKKLGITAPASFNPSGNVTRGQFATFFIQTNNQEVEFNVASVSAINATTLKVTGSGLKALKAEDITVENNVVSTVTAAEDGKSATITLSGVLAVGQEYKVTVKTESENKEFNVSYALEAKTVAIKDTTFDDDTKDQKLTVLVDGVETTVDYLLSAGYTVEFFAYDKDGDVANDKFFGETNDDDPNKTGVLKSTGTIDVGDYTVTVRIVKGSNVLTSQPAKVNVRNLDNNATAISSYEFFNTAGNKAVGGTGADADVKQTSKTLVIGEKAYLGTVTLGVGSSATEILGTTTGVVEIKSSNEAIVSVDETTNLLTAEGIGTAKITVTVGKATTTFDVKVSGVTRKATKINASPVKVVAGNAGATAKVTVFDQYGDPLLDQVGQLESVLPESITGFSSTAATVTTDENGEATIALNAATAEAGESGTVIIRNADTKDTVGSFVVTITENNAVASTKLIYASDSESKDDVINAELPSDDTIKYLLRDYSSEKVTLKTYGAGDYEDYVVKFNGKIVSVNGNATGEYKLAAGDAAITVGIVDAGTTTLAIYKPDGTLVDQKTIKVNQGSTKIKSVSWKNVPVINYSTTIDYKTVLDVTEAVTGKDPVVKGITLSSPTAYPVRIATGTLPAHTNGTTAELGDIYIDLDNDGEYDIDETILGKLTFTATSSSTGITMGADVVAGTTVAVGATSKGFINFQITDETSTDAVKPIVSTKSVEVNVK